MRIKDFVGWIKPGTYNIGFINDEGRDDETQFSAENIDDLVELWEEFCRENGFRYDSVTYVEEADDE